PDDQPAGEPAAPSAGDRRWGFPEPIGGSSPALPGGFGAVRPRIPAPALPLGLRSDPRRIPAGDLDRVLEDLGRGEEVQGRGRGAGDEPRRDLHGEEPGGGAAPPGHRRGRARLKGAAGETRWWPTHTTATKAGCVAIWTGRSATANGTGLRRTWTP